MLKSIFAGEISPANAGKFMEWMEQRHEYLLSDHRDLTNRATTLVNSVRRAAYRTAVICILALPVSSLYPEEYFRPLVFILAVLVIPLLLLDIFFALSGLSDLKRLMADGVIMSGVFRYQVQFFKGRGMLELNEVERHRVEMFDQLPDFNGVTSGRYFQIWLTATMAVLLFVATATLLLACSDGGFACGWRKFL